ncbi:MAG TPA: hypothetical protein VE177_05160 [Candidatus Binatus sp.]|nr:hypothetical protein [Candidatus Binatus sp.]
MSELKIYLPDDLDARFRKFAMEAFGYGRGSLSKAAVEAISKWCLERSSATRQSVENVPSPEATAREVHNVSNAQLLETLQPSPSTEASDKSRPVAEGT